LGLDDGGWRERSRSSCNGGGCDFVGVYFCGGFIFIAVDVSLVGDYEKLIILAIIAAVRSQESGVKMLKY